MGANKPLVWIAEPDGFPPSAIQLLEQHGTVIAEKVVPSQLREVLDKCDVLLFRLGLKITSDYLSSSQKCKLLATPVTGLDHIDLVTCKKFGIHCISLKGEYEFLKEIRATSEFTFAVLFALIRNLIPAVHSVQQGKFDRNAFQGYELYGKTFGIIGYGRIGRQVAKYATSFGMKVLACDNNSFLNTDHDKIEIVSLDDLLDQSDFVSIHVDANESNTNLVNSSFLSKMKKTAFLVNTSRGSVIDELALIQALKEKQIQGAALDVIQGEPFVDFNREIFSYQKKHSNLLITPHLGGYTHESLEKAEKFIANKIIEYIVHA